MSIRWLIRNLVITLTGLTLFGLAGPAMAQNSTINGLDKTAINSNLINQVTAEDASKNVTNVVNSGIGNIIRGVLGVVGAFFLVLTIYGGLTWMNAQGNEPKIEKAKEILKASAIGIFIIFAAYAIVNQVIDILAGPKP